MPRLFHVTSTSNRASIDAHGLDWRLMNSARGIAGSTRPEEEGIFVCIDEYDAEFFLRVNNTGGPVDVWAIDGIDEELIESGSGFFYVPHAIPRDALTLIRQDIPPRPLHPAPPGDVAFSGGGLTMTDEDWTAPPGNAAPSILDDL